MSFDASIMVPEIAVRLAGEIEAVIAALSLHGARQGKSFVAECPWSHPGRRAAPKLYIRLQAPRGTWIDFRTGDKGDALWLVAMVLSGGVRDHAALKEAVAWAKHRYGFGSGQFDHKKWAEAVARDKARLAQMEHDAEAELKALRGKAFRKWLKAAELAPGQSGYDYLAARAIDLRRLGKIPRAIRFAAREDFYHHGKVIHSGPCLMTTMTQADGSFGALHRIWFDPDRPGEKADLGCDPDTGKPINPRKMWPDSGGCIMRLWRGSSGLSEKEAVKHGLLDKVVVCEGVEDGLSLALIDPSRRVIAAGSLSGLLLMTPPGCIDTLTIAADNDWNNPQALAQLEAAQARFIEEFGLTVKVAFSPVGKDFNDLLRGKA